MIVAIFAGLALAWAGAAARARPAAARIESIARNFIFIISVPGSLLGLEPFPEFRIVVGHGPGVVKRLRINGKLWIAARGLQGLNHLLRTPEGYRWILPAMKDPDWELGQLGGIR